MKRPKKERPQSFDGLATTSHKHTIYYLIIRPTNGAPNQGLEIPMLIEEK